MKVVKSLAIAAVAMVMGSFAFAEGFSVGGYWRSEFTDTITKADDDDADPESYVSALESTSGHNLGIGKDRLRLNLDYEGEDAGVTFRYQADKGIYLPYNGPDGFGAMFDIENVKWAMGHIMLNDGMFDVEVGKLCDNYTGTNGYNGYAFDGVYGARLVCLPMEGLAVTAQFEANEDAFSKDLLSFTVGYSNEDFNCQAGYNLSGTAFYGFQLTSVEDFDFVVDGTFATKDASGAKNEDGEDVIAIRTDIGVSYVTGAVTCGLTAELSFVEDANAYALFPYFSMDLSDSVLEGLSAGLDVAYYISDDDTVDGAISVTPEVTYTKGNATLQGFYTFGKAADDEVMHSFGLGLKYAF